MRNSRALRLAALIALLAAAVSSTAREPDWAPFSFLVGEWTGEGGGEPGQAAGGFSFHYDLQDRVLVRKSRADYPASAQRPAFSHEDLTMIYRESPTAPFQAIYFDGEGHVIHYSVGFSTDGNTITFLSDAAPASPRYRLTYQRTGKDAVTIRFEIAPPGKPDGFSTYVDAKARRKPGSLN